MAIFDSLPREHAYVRCLARLQQNSPWLYLMHPIVVFVAQKGTSGLSIDHKGTLNTC